MKNIVRIPALLTLVLVSLIAIATPSANNDDSELLQTRETVWRAWFADDMKTLRELVPADTIVISASEEKWKNQSDVLREADEFHSAGGKLLRLDFPHTEVQHFGDVAIIWSSYELELETNGKLSKSSGRATEIFVRRNGHWTNPGWHTDSFKAAGAQ